MTAFSLSFIPDVLEIRGHFYGRVLFVSENIAQIGFGYALDPKAGEQSGVAASSTKAYLKEEYAEAAAKDAAGRLHRAFFETVKRSV